MHSAIIEDFLTQLEAANLGYPIAYPNVKFDDVEGVYLEVTHAPNSPIDDTLSSQSVVQRGLFQVSVIGRQHSGIIRLNDIAQEVANVFPKLTPIASVKVSRVPYTIAQVAIEGGRVELPVTIEYVG